MAKTGDIQAHTDFAGHTITYGYDPLDRLSSVSQPVTQPSPIGTQTRITSFVYDGVGNRTRMTDPLGHVTTYQYDAADQPTGLSWLDAQGMVVAGTGTAYDANGNVSSLTDADSHTTSYLYDTLNRLQAATDPLAQTTTYGYDLAGNRTLERSPAGYCTATGYDGANRPVLTTNPDSTTAATAYDANGNVTGRTDENLHTTTYTYDALDRVSALLDARLKQTSYGYDAAGNLTSLQLPLNPPTTYAYDQLNRRTSAQDPIHPATTYGYDPDGNLASVQDPLGHTTGYSYDEANEPVKVTQPDASVLLTGYDADGNVVRAVDAANGATTYSYDVLNHPTGRTDPLLRTTGYLYDPAGNLTSLTDATQPTGRVTSYGYDAADQLRTIAYRDGVTPNVTFTYTPDGQRATMADGTGTTAYGYDSRDRLTSQTDGAGQRVGYGYDPASNLTRIDYPTTGQSVQRTYDQLDRLTGVADWLGHTTTFGYDDNSNLSGIAYPTSNGLTATFGHDAADGLTGIADSAKVGGVQTPFWSYGYTLDGLGQVATVNDPVQPGAVQHTYARNALDQLTADARSGTGTGTTTWGYDSAYRTTGRADSAAGTGDTYGVDAAGELTSLVTKIGTTTTRNITLTYNADGDRTGQSDSVSGSSASYAYDGDGLRATKTVGGTTSQETWDVAEGLPTLLQDGGTRYIYGPGGTPIEQVDGAGTVRYYLQDHLGSVRGLADSSGAITDSYSYDPYGQRSVVTGSAADTPFGYAGQYTDQETGFQYLRARYYDPATGQFLTVDPLVDTTGHPYAYAADNPANATDPSGLDICNDSTPIFGHACQAAGDVHNAVDHAARWALRQAVIGLNDAITSFAQSDFSNGVNDAVIAFALSVQNLPNSVHGLISGYLAHPRMRSRCCRACCSTHWSP